MKRISLVIALLLVTMCGTASAVPLDAGTIFAPSTLGTTQYVLNPPGYDFDANPYSLNLSTLGPVTISGTADLTNAPVSEYYFVIKIVDQNLSELSIVMTTAELGGWYGIPAQPWDRVSGEASYYDPDWNGAGRIEKWFPTEGGITDSGYPGGAGVEIYPTDRTYDFEMTVDPNLETLAILVSAIDIDGVKKTLDLGFFSVDGVFNDDKTQDFDWCHTQIMAKLYGVDGSVDYWNMDIDPIPSAVPEPTTLLLLGFGLIGIAGLRRKA